MSSFEEIFSNNLRFFDDLNQSHNIYDSIDSIVYDFSGIYIVYNKDNLNDFTFRLMGTYITKKGNKTKKKQLYSLGLKDINKLDSDSITLIRKKFEKFVLVFAQLKHFRLIMDVELQKEELERK
ncbi:hypothetical protein N5T78_04170 [Aliarcobacter cryaerophilus]|uniref:hypothetical protein n=1 Tax=Aliarcobacter cryaerophilus TaxID=28198 RepID=UPI0021B5FFD7|nr:hypothetical protein [Aliarcobacter cryaerophilus]MCT7465778.1 hypothetical protein [Aliarcobacter cryaerophilus]